MYSTSPCSCIISASSEIISSINNSELLNALSPPIPRNGKIEVVVTADLNPEWLPKETMYYLLSIDPW